MAARKHESGAVCNGIKKEGLFKKKISNEEKRQKISSGKTAQAVVETRREREIKEA